MSATNTFLPAITALERKYQERQKEQSTLLGMINSLREEAGMPAWHPAPEAGSGSGNVISEIRPDTFYGKKMQTAVREYLEMRRAKDMGPATPREIYDTLKEGGYQFGASSDETAMIGLRAMLRKRTQFFHKLPNGNYGLTAWYEHVKTSKAAAAAASDDEEFEDE